MYTPHNWIIVKISHPDEIIYKILAGWSGSYLEGDSWRMNSGITKVEEEENHILFYGHSGSVYKCHKDTEALLPNIAYVYRRLEKEYPGKIDRIWYEDFINEFNPD